jgi:histidinol-phosphate phosphatase family protein
MNSLPAIDQSWSLFLDRDGVINHEKDADYIRNWSEFRFYDGVTDAMKIFHQLFLHIVVVTNQKGVGKGWMLESDLTDIHEGMKKEIHASGGRLDKVYYCIDLEDESPNRKPNAGMGLQAAKDFPGINFEKSMMVGNTMSDMEFGKKLGLFTIYLPTTRGLPEMPNPLIDAIYPNLLQLAKALQKKAGAQ